MKRCIILLLFIYFTILVGPVFAQTILHGTVTDSLGQPVSMAGIVLKRANNIIVAYTSCNEKGTFSLKVPPITERDTLWVEAGSLGYKKLSKMVTSANTTYNFSLSVNNEELKTVIIKDTHPKLRVKGDTIIYKVTDFTATQDRVIGDILKKLPGINVDANGKISYNGKAISNFYINGDNLLDDKYNIATTTIPNNIVENVQIIENDQPIKILRNRSFSDNVALNITFKKDSKLKLLGQVEAGAGFTDKYVADINGMTFKDKYKAINYIKANNTGVDVAFDLISHNSSDWSRNDKPGDLLALGTAGLPNLPENRYLFDNAILSNFNNLINIRKDVQIKLNISYLHDRRNQFYEKFEETYTSSDTIGFTEFQNNKQTLSELSGKINLNINKENYYLNNALITNFNDDSENALLLANSKPAQQYLTHKPLDFSNELTYMLPAKNGLIFNIYSYADHISIPENLTLETGLDTIAFNYGMPYKQLQQQTNIPSWFTNNYISVRQPWKLVFIQLKTGFTVQSQLLKSDLLSVQNNNTIKNARDSSSNELNWLRKTIYGSLGLELLTSKVKLSLDLPIALQQTGYSESRYNLSQSSSHFYFNPRLRFKYQSGQESYFSINYSLTNSVGNIDDVYRGYILKNYRTLFTNNADLTELQNQNVSLGFYYRKAIQLFFTNLIVTYNRRKADNIVSSLTTSDFQSRIVLPFDNVNNSWNIAGTISKYIFFLNSTLSVVPNWRSNTINLIQNGALLPYNTKFWGISANMDTKINKRLDVNYKGSLTYINSFSQRTANSSISEIKQHANINYNAAKNFFFRLTGDDYIIHQKDMSNSEYFFTDLTTQVNFPKKKINLSCVLTNLFDIKSYNSAYLSGNVFSSNTFKIQGRILLVKITCNY